MHTGGSGKDQAAPAKPRLSNRMRRYAKAHPQAVAEISPLAVQDASAQYEATGAANSAAKGAATAPPSNNVSPLTNR